MPLPDYLAEAIIALDANTPAYDQAEAFYLGEVDEVITSHRLRQLFSADTFSAFRVNFAATPCDCMIERTAIQGIACSDSTALKQLDRIWDSNQLGLEAKDIHKMAYVFGDSYLIGWPDDALDGGVSLYAHDPRSVRVFYDPQRPREKSHAIHRWVEQGDQLNGFGEGLFTRVNIYWADVVEQWRSQYRVDGTHGMPVDSITGSGGEPELVPLAEDPVVANPTGIVPVFHFRAGGRPYGRPEHADAFGPQHMITKLTTNMMISVDFSGYPQRYVTTDSALSAGPPSDGFGPPPEDSFAVDADPGLSPDSAMEAGPGSTWLLSGANVKVGQFATAQTENFLRAIESLIRQMASVTDTPGHYFDRAGQMPSGEAFRRSEAPLNNKVEDREALFGVSWHEVFEYCLAVSGMASSDAMPIWAPPSVWTDQDSWRTAALELAAGVPLDHVLRERGFSEDLIEEIVPAEAPVPEPPPDPDTGPPSSPNQGESGL